VCGSILGEVDFTPIAGAFGLVSTPQFHTPQSYFVEDCQPPKSRRFALASAPTSGKTVIVKDGD
jgi:hypothetical protein